MRALLLLPLLLAGCASPDYVASRSDFDVCRLSMRGPHAANAQAEARGRGLNCQAYYPAINAQQQGQNAAIQQLLTPAPASQMRSCTSYRIGNTVQTDCQ